MRSNLFRLPKQLEPELTHQWAANAICYEFGCLYRKMLSCGAVLLVTDSEGRRGIVCDPWCRGPRGGSLAAGCRGRSLFADEEGEVALSALCTSAPTAITTVPSKSSCQPGANNR
jgi:hypothetical protein